ncbi:hypothetical protein KKC60_03500, partial [Patescibacteria group bacterium]|nr:hypothetical protein [Patescibacteria group bacterium]
KLSKEVACYATGLRSQQRIRRTSLDKSIPFGMLLLYEHGISGYGFYAKAFTHICLRYATANIRYADTLCDIVMNLS